MLFFDKKALKLAKSTKAIEPEVVTKGKVEVKTAETITGEPVKYIKISKAKGQRYFTEQGYIPAKNKNYLVKGDTYVHYNNVDKSWHIEAPPAAEAIIPEVKPSVLDKTISRHYGNIRAFLKDVKGDFVTSNRITYREMVDVISKDRGLSVDIKETPIDPLRPLGETTKSYVVKEDWKELRPIPKEVYDAVKVQARPAAEAKPAVKEVWEETKQEVFERTSKDIKKAGFDIRDEDVKKNVLFQHRKITQEAVEQGKPVPREVLEEYKSEPWAKEALEKS